MNPKIVVTFDKKARRGKHGFMMKCNETLELLQDQRDLEATLLESARYTNPDSAAGEKLRASMSRITAHIKRLYQTIPAHKRPPTAESAVKAQEVFSTPELLEHIMCYFSTYDKLSSMAVQRCWRDTLNGSVKLKRLLGLEPFDKNTGFFYSPFATPCVNDIDYRDKDNIPGGQLSASQDGIVGWGVRGRTEIDVRLDYYEEGSSRVACGSRVREMRICNGLPLRRMEVWGHCMACHVDEMSTSRSKEPEIIASSPLGFTVGELADKAAETWKTHRNCAKFGEFSFGTRLTLHHDDPIMAWW